VGDQRGAGGLARHVLAGVVALVGLATLAGLFDRLWWPFQLADVFRLQYLAVLLGAALLAIGLRRPQLAAAAAMLAAVNFAVVGIPLTGAARAAEDAKGSLRLVIANVEVGNTDFAAIEQLVARMRPDVIGIVELTPGLAARLTRALPEYRMRVLAPRDDAYGIGLFSRVPLAAKRVVHLPTDGGPPSVVARTRVAGAPVTLVVTHVHTPFAGPIHEQQLRALAAVRPRLGERVAICGDFNAPPWAGRMRELAENAELQELYGSGAWRGYSWPTWSPLLRVPLDNCFVGGGVAVKSHEAGPAVGSDHFPLVVTLGVTAHSARVGK
jgi:endonuclease/exonuclease/phosphatase (EEP) superfamily protein YafD